MASTDVSSFEYSFMNNLPRSAYVNLGFLAKVATIKYKIGSSTASYANSTVSASVGSSMSYFSIVFQFSRIPFI